MMKHSTKRIVNPEFFIRTLKNIDGSPINPREQMDVDEFITRLMDTLEDDLKESGFRGSDLTDSFCGKLFQEIRCSQCDHASTKIDNFLCLNITTKGFTSLRQSLEHFNKAEILDGDNKYMCEKCMYKVKAHKQISISSLPDILIISLKRFEFDYTIL